MTHPLTGAVLARFPLAYQDADAASGDPLLRWLSLLWDQVGEVTDIADRINPDGAPSALTDPQAADAPWLPWLAQFVGLELPATMGAYDMRAAIAGASFQHGTVPAIIAAAKRYLKPGAVVRVFPFMPDQWHYTVQVYGSQVIGMAYRDLSLHYSTYSALTGAFTTYGGFSDDQADLIRALTAEKPAGMVMTLSITAGLYMDLTDGWATYTDLSGEFTTYDDMTSWIPEE